MNSPAQEALPPLGDYRQVTDTALSIVVYFWVYRPAMALEVALSRSPRQRLSALLFMSGTAALAAACLAMPAQASRTGPPWDRATAPTVYSTLTSDLFATYRDGSDGCSTNCSFWVDGVIQAWGKNNDEFADGARLQVEDPDRVIASANFAFYAPDGSLFDGPFEARFKNEGSLRWVYGVPPDDAPYPDSLPFGRWLLRFEAYDADRNVVLTASRQFDLRDVDAIQTPVVKVLGRTEPFETKAHSSHWASVPFSIRVYDPDSQLQTIELEDRAPGTKRWISVTTYRAAKRKNGYWVANWRASVPNIPGVHNLRIAHNSYSIETTYWWALGELVDPDALEGPRASTYRLRRVH